ncbi:MAG TPA: hypothetical protein VG734_05635 [Lacunisphaera sp.]|nr:hypothetical protein [Lacunisphaera sp.]
MNNIPSAGAARRTQAQIEAGQSRYFVASFNLFFVFATAGFMLFGVVFPPGGESNQVADNLIRVPILIACALGSLAAVGAWLVAWFRLVSLRREAKLLADDDNS